MATMQPIMAWTQRAERGMQQIDAVRSALRELTTTPGGDELLRVVRSGTGFDDPFDALVTLAREGRPAGYHAWSRSQAAASLLERAAREAAPATARTGLSAAHAGASHAAGQIEGFFASGASTRSMDALRGADVALADARAGVQAVLDSLGAAG